MMTFKWVNIYIFTYIITSECSQVIDYHNQKGLHISDYCPRIGSCEEGSHVMCLYYNPIKKMGPTCSNPANASITPEFAQMILDVVNRIRSKVAAGTAKGREGTTLPKGYGIYRLNWDEELATFAQVWANQCIMKSDLCRDTRKFSKVGQTLGMSRFTINNWQPLHSSNYVNSSILDQDKVKYAITAVIKAWYDMRSDVTAEDIKLTGDRSSKMLINQFFNLIYGNLTHIGCGISAYREYAYHDNNAALNYNSVQVVCNYSARLHSGFQVYTTDPPTKPGYTVKCGCPLGYDEDEDCLCYETKRKLPYSCKDSSRCKPSVVVLPIFTVDDAPKALQDLGHNNATLLKNTRGMFDRYDLNSLRTNNKHGISFDIKRQSGMPVQRYVGDVRSRYFGRNMGSSNNHYRADIPHQLPRVGSNQRSKQSVFLKAPIFDLTVRKTNPIAYQKLVNNVNKKDVAPRKDFTEVQKLVSNYLDKKRHSNTFNNDKESDGYNSYEPLTFHYNHNPNTFKNHNVIRNNYNAMQKYSNSDFNSTNNFNLYDDVKVVNVNGDRKLMSLLDSLEQKIKEVELNTNEKEIFDEKIRRIYVTLVGKSDFKEKYMLNVLWNNNSKANEINNYNVKVDNKGMLRNYQFDSMRPEDYSYRDINDNHPSYDGDSRKNFSRYNWNNDDTNHPLVNLNFDDIENKGMRNVYNFRKEIQRNLENDDYYLKNINDEELTESNRRRYYDNKLATLRRKIDLMKSNVYQHKVHQDRKLRPVRPTIPAEEQKPYIKSKESMNTFYMPDRARFLHGF